MCCELSRVSCILRKHGRTRSSFMSRIFKLAWIRRGYDTVLSRGWYRYIPGHDQNHFHQGIHVLEEIQYILQEIRLQSTDSRSLTGFSLRLCDFACEISTSHCDSLAKCLKAPAVRVILLLYSFHSPYLSNEQGHMPRASGSVSSHGP